MCTEWSEWKLHLGRGRRLDSIYGGVVCGVGSEIASDLKFEVTYNYDAP